MPKIGKVEEKPATPVERLDEGQERQRPVTNDGMPSKQARYPEALRSPTIHLAHVPGAQGDNVLLGQRGVAHLPDTCLPALLVSYYYLDGFLNKQSEYHYRDWMMDSGAYSAYNSGAVIDLNQYIEACHKLLEVDKTLKEIIALDVIGSGAGSLKNAQVMKAAGLDVIPVFHIGEDWQILKEYCKDYNKVGLSCRFGEPMKKSIQFYDQCFARGWPKKFHSFGWIDEVIMMKYPFHSGDSSSWEVGPCLTGDAMISTAQGFKPIAELVEQADLTIRTYQGMEVPNCKAVYSGSKEVLRLTLKNDQELRCTGNHKILTENGWKEAGRLQIGDNIRVPDKQIKAPVLKEALIDEMLGWSVGDGWYSLEPSRGPDREGNDRASFGVLFAEGGDDEAKERLLPAFDEFSGKTYETLVSENRSGILMFRKATGRKEVLSKLRELGFKPGRAIDKQLPTYIYTARPEQQLAFLRGLFSADGGVKNKKGSVARTLRGSSSIILSSHSKKLLPQVQLLLMEYGIHSHISWTTTADKPFKHHVGFSDDPLKRNPDGELSINGLSAAKFMRLIGFNLTAKNDKYRTGYFSHEQKKYFQVAKIEKLGTEDVYDILMPQVHHFLANGMVVHNCAFANWKFFGKMSVRGSSQNLRSQVEWYLDLEDRLRNRWKKEMAKLDTLEPISVRLVVGSGRSLKSGGIDAFRPRSKDGKA